MHCFGILFILILFSSWCGSGGLVPWMCLTLCDPMDCSPQGSPVHGISQTQVSCIAGKFFIDCATRKALIMMLSIKILSCNIFISNKFIKSRGTLYFKHHPKLAVIFDKLYLDSSFAYVCSLHLLNLGKKQLSYSGDRDEFDFWTFKSYYFLF